MDFFLRVGLVGLTMPPYIPVLNRREEEFDAPAVMEGYYHTFYDAEPA